MFRFTIRDVLWLTVVVAVALTLWLAWSREATMLRDECAAMRAKLNDEVAAERDKAKAKMSRILSEYGELMVKSKVHDAKLERLRASRDITPPHSSKSNQDTTSQTAR